MKYWTYIHTCPNGKKYVGITTREKPEDRWCKGTRYAYNKHFYSAIQKYGWDNIKHEAWEFTSKSEMYYAEKYLIAYYQTTNPRKGYNNSSGGEKSGLGSKHTEEWKKEMSKLRKGREHPWAKGVPRSEESKRKTSETLRGRPQPRFLYTFPDGTTKAMTAVKAFRAFKSRGIFVEKGPRVI